MCLYTHEEMVEVYISSNSGYLWGREWELNRWGTRMGRRFLTIHLTIFWVLERCECIIYSKHK